MRILGKKKNILIMFIEQVKLAVFTAIDKIKEICSILNKCKFENILVLV